MPKNSRKAGDSLRKQNKDKRESGQAIVEFAFVLPLFLILVMGILDFGWLFYNYISLENTARNAARIACVQQDCKNICFDLTTNEPKNKEFPINAAEIAEDNPDLYTREETAIVKMAASEFPNSVTNGKLTISYSYDKAFQGARDYNVENRYTGDVTVTVTGKMRVLTPVLGAFSDNMQKELKSSATYKVERQSDSNFDDLDL